MAKIAAGLNSPLLRQPESFGPGKLEVHALASGDGWSVDELVCNSGPRDRPFEEQHSCFHIAIVASGTFQYRSAKGRVLMTPGSLLLGNPGQHFECGHEHGVGDRCLSFGYTREYFGKLATDVGAAQSREEFKMLRLPPLRWLSPLIARACACLAHGGQRLVEVPWEELHLQLAERTLAVANGISPGSFRATAGPEARVTRTVRMIEQNPEAKHALGSLARDAGLSPYHFLRTFQRLTGVTPHQYILRTRLRRAAMCLESGRSSILDIAFDCGFRDVSNFNHAFRAEFGISPRAYRFQKCGRC